MFGMNFFDKTFDMPLPPQAHNGVVLGLRRRRRICTACGPEMGLSNLSGGLARREQEQWAHHIRTVSMTERNWSLWRAKRGLAGAGPPKPSEIDFQPARPPLR